MSFSVLTSSTGEFLNEKVKQTKIMANITFAPSSIHFSEYIFQTNPSAVKKTR
jgi:hypothetical protein